MFLFFINPVSASYNCSNETSFIEDQKEIELYEKKTINGIELGLINSYEIPRKNLAAAELMIDAEKFSLANLTPSQKVPLASGEYNLSLNNIAGKVAKIGVSGVIKSIDEKDTVTINGLDVFVFNMQGAYPGEGSLEGIVGKEKIILSSDKNEVIELNGTDYLLELYLASDSNAIINVKKCNWGEIIEIKDEIKNLTLQNITIENSTATNISTKNITIIANKSNLEETNKTLQNQTDTLSKKDFSFFGENFVIILSTILVTIILIAYLWYRYNRGAQIQ